MFHAKCIVKRCECHGGGSFKSVISSCLQNEPVTQIYCTHSQELCPKLIPILKSCVFLCMSGGFSRRWKVEVGGWGRGKQAWRQGLGSLCVSPSVDDALGPSALAPILPLLLPASSSPSSPFSFSISLSHCLSLSLSFFFFLPVGRDFLPQLWYVFC